MPGRPSVTLRSANPLVSRRRRRIPRGPAPRRLARWLVAGAGVVALGCASSPDIRLPGPDSTTPPLPKVQFLAQANEICRATTKLIAERTEDVGVGNLAPSSGERQKLKDEVEPIARLALSRLRNLTPPAEDAALVRQGLDAMQAAVDSLGSDPQAPFDPVGLNRPEQFEYGLTGCFTTR
jgi:hypothetical protein